MIWDECMCVCVCVLPGDRTGNVLTWDRPTIQMERTRVCATWRQTERCNVKLVRVTLRQTERNNRQNDARPYVCVCVTRRQTERTNVSKRERGKGVCVCVCAGVRVCVRVCVHVCVVCVLHGDRQNGTNVTMVRIRVCYVDTDTMEQT